jgi:type IV pilus assembly protein PilB
MPATALRPETGPLVLEILSRRGRLDPAALAAANKALAQNTSALPERSLVKAGIVTDDEVAALYAEALAIPLLVADAPSPADPATLARLLPEKYCTSNLVAAIDLDGDALDMAFTAPDQLALVEEIQFLTGKVVRPRIAPISAVERRLDAIYQMNQELVSGAAATAFDHASDAEADDPDADQVLQLDRPPPPGDDGRVIRMVNQILEQAMRTNASDIHLETFEDCCKFRLRIDGVLHEMPSPGKSVLTMILSRFKILAKMDIAERRVPQDGAISVRSSERRFDLRVNTVPTVYGEKMVMRILDKEAIPLDLTRLGLDQRQVTDLMESIRMPHGLALVTGPTGSGKSTTLYSCLNLLNESRTNICTVEDPVEYRFKGINQVQVKPLIGLNFSSALRAFLRQDPDVIMVGEVRDQETADICLRAALTGHFVLSTIHTNDALAAVTRLQDMGIEPFLLASTLRVLEAQRLVRRLCVHCREPYTVDAALAERHGLIEGETLYRPKGCPQCRRMGYRGRVGVFEVIRITPVLASLIQARTPLNDLRKAAVAEGMKLLYDSAIDKARDGLTSLEAALTVAVAEGE